MSKTEFATNISTVGEANEAPSSGNPRLSSSDLKRFSEKAKQGNVDAMYTLSTHYFTISNVNLGYYWLREAASLGECHAILHLIENTFSGVEPAEILHWRKEKERLHCDPMKDDIVKPEINLSPAR